ncbi:MAG TPA: response regulator [Nitrospirota bacterium]
MNRKILYIEDNEQNLYLVRYILEKNGYLVTGAMDGPEGLAAASRDLPALILLDIQLPGMDGYEVARKLREQRELRDIPIVAVTSYAMAGDRERALEAGCTGYIEKPINPETFLLQIERHLPDRTPSGGASR